MEKSREELLEAEDRSLVRENVPYMVSGVNPDGLRASNSSTISWDGDVKDTAIGKSMEFAFGHTDVGMGVKTSDDGGTGSYHTEAMVMILDMWKAKVKELKEEYVTMTVAREREKRRKLEEHRNAEVLKKYMQEHDARVRELLQALYAKMKELMKLTKQYEDDRNLREPESWDQREKQQATRWKRLEIFQALRWQQREKAQATRWMRVEMENLLQAEKWKLREIDLAARWERLKEMELTSVRDKESSTFESLAHKNPVKRE